MFEHIVPILNNNIGNVLTEELIFGIVASLHKAHSSNSINVQDIPPAECGDYSIQVERIEDVLSELKPLHVAHWQETERYRHGIPLNPDYNYMINAERNGRFLLFTVRIDGVLVGNMMLYISRSTHTQNWVAEEDTMFILEEHRKGRLGVRLIQYGEEILRNLGITEVRVTVKTVNNVGRLLSHLGYTHAANQFIKTLE